VHAVPIRRQSLVSPILNTIIGVNRIPVSQAVPLPTWVSNWCLGYSYQNQKTSWYYSRKSKKVDKSIRLAQAQPPHLTRITLYCKVCRVKFNAAIQAQQHYSGKLHARKCRLASAEESKCDGIGVRKFYIFLC